MRYNFVFLPDKGYSSEVHVLSADHIKFIDGWFLGIKEGNFLFGANGNYVKSFCAYEVKEE